MGRATLNAVVGFAAGLAAGVVVGLVLGWVRGPAAEPLAESVRIDAPRGDARDTDAGRREPRRRVRPVGESTESSGADTAAPAPAIVLPPRAAGDPDVREFAVAGAPTGWSDLEVQLLDADGEPRSGWAFEVIAAASTFDRQADEDDIPAHGETGPDGVGRVRVASPGRYVVEVGVGPYVLRQADVVVPTLRRVVVRDVAYEEIRLTVAADEPDPAEDVGVSATACSDAVATSDGTWVADASGNGLNTTLNAARRTGTIDVPAALRWRVGAADGWVCTPPVVTAPAEVQVRRVTGAQLVVTVVLRSTDPPVANEREIAWVLDAGCGEDRESFWVDSLASADGAEAGARLWAPKREGVLRWSGPEIEPGEVPYDLANGPEIRIEMRHRPAAEPSARTARIVVEPETPLPEGTTLEGTIWRKFGDDATHDVDLLPSVEAPVTAEGGWFLMTRKGDGPDPRIDVAGPLRLVAGTRHSLKLGEGGWLVVVPRRLPPPGAGRIEIVRADGGPVVLTDSDGDPRVEWRVAVEAGTVLGPFEPGAVVLDVLVGRVKWQRLEATIRAGERTALPIGPFGAAPK